MDVTINGNLENVIGHLRVDVDASVSFNGNLSVNNLTLEANGSLVITGNMEFAGTLSVGGGGKLTVEGNVACESDANAFIDSDMITIGGDNTCSRL